MLKTGAHMWGLEHLLKQYPDARIVFTHRDPVKSMTSYASLTALVRSMGSDDVDREEIAADWIHRLQHVLSHAMDVRETQKRAIEIYEQNGFIKFGENPFYAMVSKKFVKGYYYYKQL